MILTLAIVAALVLGLAVYAVSLRIHPWRPCRACAGSGKARDRIWRQAHGTCKACGGKGRKPRLGVRVLQPARARRMTGARPKHKSIDERRG